MMKRYVTKGNKRLRYGYTTGSCAAGAAKAAAAMLLGGEPVHTVELPTPKGWQLSLTICDIMRSGNAVSCAVQKDSGDDPDVTDGMLIYARVSKCESGVRIHGGKGIGVVTQKGLTIPVGSPAINDTPRWMITEAVADVAVQFGYDGGLDVEIYAPQGEAIAKKTFNARLGVERGISILGTTGIVEPRSEASMIESLRLEMNILRGKDMDHVLFCPGNYGWAFARDEMGLDMRMGIKISNFVGEMMDHALALKFKELLLVSHIGKAVKVAGGIMNTHSRFADCRGEIMSAHGILCGAQAQTALDILHCTTTDAMVDVLKRAGLCEAVMQSITHRIEDNLAHRVYNQVKVGAVVFSNDHGLLGIGETAASILEEYKK